MNGVAGDDGTRRPVRQVVGVMTGTSIDGIDAAQARIIGRGLTMEVDLVGHISRPLGAMSAPLRAAAGQNALTAGEFAWYAHEFGKLHADVVEELVRGGGRSAGARGKPAATSPDLVCVHGQTVFHDPPLSWQLVNAAPIAQRLNCPVVFDLRQADLACGGQGAPITPLADWVLFRGRSARRAIVNLGGYCNVTVLPGSGDASDDATERHGEEGLSAIRGFDVCACNQVLDAVAREALGAHYDEDDRIASSGSVSPEASEALRQRLTGQAAHGRSLGTGDEAIAWVTEHLRELSAEDLAASAVWAVAGCIGATLESLDVDEVYVAGGGARHALLVRLLDQHCTAPVRLLRELGVPIEAREPLAMAVLGALCADGVPITLPQVTGAAEPAPVAGVWCLPGGLRQKASTVESAEGAKTARS